MELRTCFVREDGRKKNELGDFRSQRQKELQRQKWGNKVKVAKNRKVAKNKRVD